MTGIICMWSGAIVDIPDGWLLCDGNNGTPDLTDKFIMGAGSLYAPGASGGFFEHIHAFVGNGHYHWLEWGEVIPMDEIDGIFDEFTQAAFVLGITEATEALPPFNALCFIIKT